MARAAKGYDEAVTPLIRMVGPRLRERRQTLKMTFQDVTLATKGVINGNFLSALENGTVEGGITFYRVALLGEVYGFSPQELFELFGMGNLLTTLGIPNTRYRIMVPETEGE